MADGRSRDEWSRTSWLLALIANCHRDPKKTRVFRPRDFDPFARREEPVRVGVDVLKDVFIHRRVPPNVSAGSREFKEEQTWTR